MQDKHKPEFAHFVLFDKCLTFFLSHSNKKCFLSSRFPASDCRLSHPLCPISPQREAAIRTTFRPNLLHLSVLLEKLTSITASDQHTHITHSHAFLPTSTNPSTAITTNLAPQGLREVPVQLWLASSW